MFFISRFIIAWALWLIFADKKRWREIFPICFFAAHLGGTTDIIMRHYELWSYNGAHTLVRELMDDWETYIVVTYLFIQWLPKQQTFWNLFKYFFIWTTVAIGIEWIHVITGKMEYYKWWNMGCSYLSDWFLFWLFYKIHKLFTKKISFR